jgi:VWFA-related protein
LLAGATLVLMAAFAGLALAQDAGLTAQVVEVKDAGYPKAQAVVTVDDTASGSPALTAADFTVALDGQPATVSAASLASSETAPLDVLFVIDTSGSMAGVPIAQVKAAASAFIGQLAAQDRVAVMAFSDKVRLVQDYTTDHPAAASIIRGLQAAGNTALYQATAGAALKAASSPASRRAIILLSDGADYGSDGTVSREVAVDAVTKVGVPFFAIGEGTDIDAAYLQQLGSASNGRYLQAPDPRQLTDLYAGIARLLRSQYIVTFDAGAISSARTAQVVVTVTSNGRKATSSVNYAAAAPPAAGITIAGVADGESVRSARAITVDVMGVQPSGVTFSVDGQEVARSTARPFAFHFDPKAFSAGAHTLTVRVDLPSGSAVVTRAFASAVPSAGGSFDLLTLGVAVAAPLLVLLTFAFVIVRRRRRRGVGAPHAAAHIASMRARAPALPSPAEP